VDIQMSHDWFIPGSVLAEWRGEMVDNLTVNGESLTERVESPQKTPLPSAPLSSVTYLANVANHLSRQFYLDHGARQVEWAMEVEKPRTTDGHGLLLMTCRYCIRHELGMCKRQKAKTGDASPNDHTALFLRLADGRRFRLHFDCKQCQMEVYAD